jgi:hypothetical protein
MTGNELILSLAAVALGIALHISDGLYSYSGVIVLAIAFVFCAIATFSPPLKNIPPMLTRWLLAALVLAQLLAMYFKRPGASEFTVPVVNPRFFHIGVSFAVAALGMIAFGKNLIARIGFIVLLAMFAAIGIWKIALAPHPKIDVYFFQVDAAHALARGANPYAITFANIYGADASVYAPGVASGDRLLFGFPYMPLVLFLTAPATLLLGDPRYASLLAILITGILIAVMRPGRIGMLVAALLLFTPRSFYVIELAWTEPLSVMLLAATVLCAMRKPKWMPIALGLLLASKQYLPAAIFLIPLIVPRTRRESRRAKWEFLRIIATAIGIAAAVTLPLASWKFRAFWDSAIALQMHQPYRADSLSFLAWWGYRDPFWTGPFWLAFVALGIAILLCFWRISRGPAGFAIAFAFCYFAFFVFNKQAFANYYYLVIGTMCVGIAAENYTPAARSADE